MWATIADFSDPSWIAGVESFRLSGPNDRMLRMMGMEFVERQLRCDDHQRTVEYAIVKSPLRLDHHKASITVSGRGPNAFVTWDVETDDRAVDDLQRGYQRILEELKRGLER